MGSSISKRQWHELIRTKYETMEALPPRIQPKAIWMQISGFLIPPHEVTQYGRPIYHPKILAIIGFMIVRTIACFWGSYAYYQDPKAQADLLMVDKLLWADWTPFICHLAYYALFPVGLYSVFVMWRYIKVTSHLDTYNHITRLHTELMVGRGPLALPAKPAARLWKRGIYISYVTHYAAIYSMLLCVPIHVVGYLVFQPAHLWYYSLFWAATMPPFGLLITTLSFVLLGQGCLILLYQTELIEVAKELVENLEEMLQNNQPPAGNPEGA